MIDRPEIGQPPLTQPEIQPPTPDRIGTPFPDRPGTRPHETPLMPPILPDDDPMELPNIPLPSDPVPGAPEVPDAVPQYNPPREPYA
jgi:hypothetical protein